MKRKPKNHFIRIGMRDCKKRIGPIRLKYSVIDLEFTKKFNEVKLSTAGKRQLPVTGDDMVIGNFVSI